MSVKRTMLGKCAVTLLGLASVMVITDEAHAEVVDLNGYEAKIETIGGKNVISTKKGKWDLNVTTDLKSKKSQTIYLNNSKPVEIKSVEVGKTLDVRGDGELTANNQNGQYGINVGDHLRAFKYDKYGSGKLTGKGEEAGVRVYNEVQMNAGELNAEGQQFGIWSYNDIKPHDDAVINANAKADNGIGIWAYRDIYAYDGAQVNATGGASGGYSEIAHIESRGEGSLISGTSNNVNSELSALHAKKEMLRAFDGATIREIYNNPDFEITKDKPINVVDKYNAVARNMTGMDTYNWSSDPIGVFNTSEGLLGSVKDPFRKGLIIGSRTDNASKAAKGEATQLKKGGTHELMFGEVKASYTVPVKLVHLFDTGMDIFKVEKIVNIEIGQMFKVLDYQYDISFTEGEFVAADKEDFIINDEIDGYEVTYKYEGDFDETMFNE